MWNVFYKLWKFAHFHKWRYGWAARHNTARSQVTGISPLNSFQKSSNSCGRNKEALKLATSSFVGRCFERFIKANLIKIVLSERFSLFCNEKRVNSSFYKTDSIRLTVSSVMLAANTTNYDPFHELLPIVLILKSYLSILI